MTGSRGPSLLFTYGSLLRGMPNHHQLAGAAFVREASTAAPHTLLDLGAWPGVTRTPRSRVHGELYRVDHTQLARLDAFEGAPVLFRRDQVAITGGERAWIYLFEGPDAVRQAIGAPAIPHGSWRRWVARP